ncbi:stonin-2-like [Stylophora pistillata]|uniref:Stonin-2 n=1 Tax=Stylophora pistillata TaxID=50429 RepID=A0A2B4SAC7_STYPI|nr:stonin-2-like [Stylophora pistillata]PFX26059.1 Stonin-2 [Stylophora pistillata]
MDENSGTPSESVIRTSWENFEEEIGKINNHCHEISFSVKEENLSDNIALISKPKSLRQSGNSSLNGEESLTGTDFKENLDEKSKHLETSPNEINTVQQFDLEPVVDSSNSIETSDQGLDNALGNRESSLISNTGELSTEKHFIQSNDLSECLADGIALNGESESSFSAVDEPPTEEKAISSAKWTTFEDSRDKELRTDGVKSKSEELSIDEKQQNSNINTPRTTPNMAAFDSQSAVTTNIISNLPTVTEPGTFEVLAASFNHKKIGEDIASNSNSLSTSAMRSAVPIVDRASPNDNGALPLSSSSSLEPRPGDTSATKHHKGTEWVSFGEEGNSDENQRGKASLSGSEREHGNLETAKRPFENDLQKGDLAVNDTKDTSPSTVLREEKELNGKSSNEAASVIPPVSFTSAELDLLASKSWIQFDDSSKSKSVPQSNSCFAQTSSASHPWVTFGDSNTPVSQNLDPLELDVSSKSQFNVSTSPSPNPFTSVPPSSASNPFKPATPSIANPFQADATAVVSSSPYSISNQGPISSSTPLTGVKTPSVAKGSLQETGLLPTCTAELNVPHDELTLSNSTPVDNNQAVVAQDQVDARSKVLVSKTQQPSQVCEEPLREEKLLTTSGSWSMLLRFPDKKKKIGSREWKPVVIKLGGTTLQIFEEYELSAPFREIPLQAYFVFTTPKLQSFERGAKVHTVRLEYVKYTETRRLRHRGTVEHVAHGTPIIKVASPSHKVIRELLESFNNSLRLLPSYRDRGITYRQDEVFVDVEDVTNVLLSSDGTILKKNSKVLVKFRAFLTGDPECQLVLNDIALREREEARLRSEEKPQRVHHWMKLSHCDFHKCVNVTTFDQSHAITFHPLDACTFELMRFPVDHHKPLPLLLKTVLNIHSEQRVELKVEIQVCQEAKLAKYIRNNVIFRFPIPETWVPLFRTTKALRGEKSIKSSKGSRAAGIKSRLRNSKCSIAVSLGKAKYEPEYASVVWRIDQLPFIHSRIPADAPQTLTCVLDLPPGMEYPENFKPTAELEYDVAYVLVSDTTIIAVKVSNQNIPDKWVCYRASYHYQVNIDISRPTAGPVRDVGCTQQ